MEIVKASHGDVDTLTEIAFAAKRHWGYPEEWISGWEAALTVTAEYVSANPTYAAVVDEKIVGFYAIQIHLAEAVLDHLWVLPTVMRKGIGRALFAHAENIARETGVVAMRIVGDPHAEGFYRRMGAVVYDRESAAMDQQQRFLPLLRKVL